MKSIFSFILVAMALTPLWGQLPPACAGGSPATNCANACINCNFNGFVGNTTGFPSDVLPSFCGTVENAQWLGFIAGDDHAVFTVTPANCLNGDGVQIALYEDCEGQPIACEKGEMNGGLLPVSMDIQLTPGHNYFLLIDGYAGDQCDFTVSVTPESAVYEPPIGAVGSITGPDKVCPGATMLYSVSEVFGAAAYTWSGPPGAMIDTLPLPVTLTGPGANQAWITFGANGGDICVQAANSCNQTPPCSQAFQVTILDDSFRPVLEADTTAHLTCSGAPAELVVDVPSAAGFSFEWTADSLGHITGSTDYRKTTVDAIGTYTLLVTNNQNGCTSSIRIQVGEPDTPRASQLRFHDITCFQNQDGWISVGAIEGGLPPYLYSLDEQPFSIATEFRYLSPGMHRLVVESSDACRWDTLINLKEPSEWLLELGDDDSLHLGQSLLLLEDLSVSEPDRIASLSIRPAELESFLCDTCPFEPLHSFRYTLTLTDSNGCIATDSRIISVSRERYVFAPTVFSPGALDAANQTFQVYGGEDVASIEWLHVFDRWGQLVYAVEPGNSNDPLYGWNGTVNGDPANPGVFVWQANILFKDGISEKWSGNVTLIR